MTQTKMGNYIMSLLKHDFLIFACWGAEDIKHEENGITMRVNGLRYQGKVHIFLAPDDTFTIELVDDAGAVAEREEMVYFDQLATMVDAMVEVTQNYQQDLENWIMNQ